MRFEEMWPDMRYATKRDYKGGEILKGNHGACWICGADTQFWDVIENVNTCSTECNDVLYVDIERDELAEDYNYRYRKADPKMPDDCRVEYDRKTRVFKMGEREIKEESVKAMIEALKRGESTKPRFACNPNPYAGIDT